MEKHLHIPDKEKIPVGIYNSIFDREGFIKDFYLEMLKVIRGNDEAFERLRKDFVTASNNFKELADSIEEMQNASRIQMWRNAIE